MAHGMSYKRSRFTIRTSDRRVFRRCLRKWDYISSLRKNLTKQGTEQNINFWFGSAIHFAMEDYHGYNRYGDPRRAFYAYYKSFNPNDLPMEAESHYGLGISMLTYYLTWYARHNELTQFTTIWLDEHKQVVPPHTAGATPCVEQSFMVPLNVYAITDVQTDTIYAQYIPHSEGDPNAYGKLGYLIYAGSGEYIPQEDNSLAERMCYYWLDAQQRAHEVELIPMFYHGTIDKMVIDKFGRWWLVDYKTAKGADTNKLDTDDQIGAYIWAAAILFDRPIYGFIYLQLTKDAIQEPRRLKSGELSVDKRQKTTYSAYKAALIEDYGSVINAPSKHVQYLNELACAETPEGDRFIRWDFIKRNDAQLLSTARCIYAELSMMLNPQLVCFPNPTRDCSWDCPVREACIAQDREETDTLEIFFKDWEERPRTENGNTDPWKVNLPDPEMVKALPLEDILESTEELKLEFEEERSDNGFKFLYEYEEKL